MSVDQLAAGFGWAKTSLEHDTVRSRTRIQGRIVVIFPFPSSPGSMEANSKPASQSIGVGLSPGGIAEVGVAVSLFIPMGLSGSGHSGRVRGWAGQL